MVDVEVIVLAAGRSKRLGQPKALVDAGGYPLIARLVRRLRQRRDVSITAVTNDDLLADVILACPSIHVVLNPEPEQGRTGSIRCGLASILERNGRLPKRVIIAPIDRPGWDLTIFDALVNAKESSCPVWNNRGGHPIVLVGEDVNTVYLSQSNVPLSSLFHREPIHVDFPYLHLNIDTVDDLQELHHAVKEDWF